MIPRTLAIILVISLVVSASLGAQACFDPSDLYSIEVVLNKPGLKYDVSILEEIHGIVWIKSDNVFLWRSHIAPSDIIVIASLQPLSLKEGAEKYLTIRVEGKTAVVNETVRIYTARTMIDEYISSKDILRILEEYNWSIKAGSLSDSAKAVLYRKINNTSIEASLVITHTSSNNTLIYVSLKITNNISDETVLRYLKEPLEEVANTSGINFTNRTVIEQTIKPLPGISEDLLKRTLEYELKWLVNMGVIKGLTSSDIKAIIDASRMGFAGWNSRLVYFKNEWKPYYEVVKEIPGGALVKTAIGCSWSYPIEQIPLTPPMQEEPAIIATSNIEVEATTTSTLSTIPIVEDTGSPTTTVVEPITYPNTTSLQTSNGGTIVSMNSTSGFKENNSSNWVLLVIVVAIIALATTSIIIGKKH